MKIYGFLREENLLRKALWLFLIFQFYFSCLMIFCSFLSRLYEVCEDCWFHNVTLLLTLAQWCSTHIMRHTSVLRQKFLCFLTRTLVFRQKIQNAINTSNFKKTQQIFWFFVKNCQKCATKILFAVSVTRFKKDHPSLLLTLVQLWTTLLVLSDTSMVNYYWNRTWNTSLN